MLEKLTLATFAAHLSSVFQVEGRAAPPVTVELVEASEVRAPPRYEAFSIVFRGPSDAFLPQAMYRFQHDAIGAFDLFIVPIRQDQHGFYYEASFNRLRSEEPA